MRKIIISFILVLTIIFFLFSNSKNDEIRVRIIPHNNEEESLVIKEKVKELAIEFLALNYEQSFNEYKENISDNIESFNEALIEFNAKAYLKYHTFTNKSYNGISLKDETVLTFLVLIGESNGDNWWGVVYPKFLNISSTNKVEYKSYIIKKIKEWMDD